MQDSDYPVLWRSADTESLQGQVWYKRVTKFDLSVLVLGSLVGALAPILPDNLRFWSGMATGILLTAGLIAKLIVKTRRDDKSWFNGRAVAETVKSLTWRYMMKAAPFNGDDADREFQYRISEALRQARALSSRPFLEGNDTTQITVAMDEVRTRSVCDRREFYIRHRLHDQIHWYATKAQFCRRRSDFWYWVSVVAQFLAIVFAFMLVGNIATRVNLIGVFGAVGAASTAWLQLGRYDELRASYALASQELTTICDFTRRATTEDELDEAVENAESSISREHTMWMAKRGESVPVR